GFRFLCGIDLLLRRLPTNFLRYPRLARLLVWRCLLQLLQLLLLSICSLPPPLSLRRSILSPVLCTFAACCRHATDVSRATLNQSRPPLSPWCLPSGSGFRRLAAML
ncbi:unnamed protein product, partial [Ectocarpus sp. 8 AP-2014]